MILLQLKKIRKIYGQANYFITSNYCGERKLMKRELCTYLILPFVCYTFIYLIETNIGKRTLKCVGLIYFYHNSVNIFCQTVCSFF